MSDVPADSIRELPAADGKAFCPKCNQRMLSTATTCPACGSDFPIENGPPLTATASFAAGSALLQAGAGAGVMLSILSVVGALRGELPFFPGLALAVFFAASAVSFARQANRESGARWRRSP